MKSDDGAGGPAPHVEPRRRWSRWRLLASPLTRRILAVNLLAPVVLVGGLLYLDRYKQGLIRSELEGLATQAEMVAAAVGEGALIEGEFEGLEFNAETARQMVRRLAEPAKLRVRLFGSDGELVADSRFRLGANGVVHVEMLPPPRIPSWSDEVRQWWERTAHWLRFDRALPLYRDRPRARASDFAEVATALDGHSGAQVRTRSGGGLVLSVAVPVQRYKQVGGAVLITADGTNVARALFQVRLAIFQVFAVALGITIALSLYMAGTIARPIRRLALAAERVRHGQGRALLIPDLSRRGDEIGELSLALKEMTEALWRRMDAIEAFAADVAHEIKNPLTSLRSAVETAARIDNPDQRRRLMAIVLDDVGRLDRLISDISDASRIDAELSRAESAPVAVASMLDALADVYRITGGESGPSFTLERPKDDPLIVVGIESRLVQVLRNLIANAMSFSPPGGSIRLIAERSDGRIRIVVEDDGPGIPDNKLEAIFDRFYSERPEGEKFGTHSGLGLSISRQIVEAHNGRIRAENRDGGGARFIVELPDRGAV
ncbi:stimulus-sensing domain-containing protein [Magnetospirillum molischianum]|uniref:histidine kinase n=1 Tax=Magnetospirillum molischianum DSM 120 TaxID=1150626 RepID=H8FW13_MAGML|nr:stimulus-sensing domain-containing protein [Magnetospirillum molischianum]CCG42551.1 Two component Sensor protein chvG (Histidine kinase sensory protein exoS), classical system [Magnetospirillum molischianum DSM 120]